MRIINLLLGLFLFSSMYAAEWQWSVKLKDYISPETNASPEAYLWIPPNCNNIKAVMFGQHNMCEETIFEHPVFRQTMTELGIAIVWLTPGIDQQWDVKKGSLKYFDTMMSDLAELSGYSELNTVPVVPLGHSAMATFPWNFAAWNPERTLAVISYHGDAPRTNLTGYGGDNLEWGRTRNIDGIPGLMIEGEYEWWEARVNPALAFRMMYPQSTISFLCDAGHGHFDVSDAVVDYMCLFLKKAVQYRLSGSEHGMKSIDITEGWLADRWYSDGKQRASASQYINYGGDPHDAFWYFDEETAMETEKYYARSSGKKYQYIGLKRNGKLLPFYKDSHSQYHLNFEPLTDGLNFHISATFTDSLRQHMTTDHSPKEKIQIARINGPVKKVNDSTFTVQFYRMGLDNPKRTGDIWLLAHHLGDEKYKSSVQQLNIKVPYPNTEGRIQQINFPELQDINSRQKTVKLDATADSKLPVSYYVKVGPVELVGNELIIGNIPPKAKYPLAVTVVAWQYGSTAGEKVQTAKAVERTFYINND